MAKGNSLSSHHDREDTIAKAILAKISDDALSVSATTRPIRPGEINGKDYFFLTRQEFEDRIGIGDLVEWEEIYGNYYGTLKAKFAGPLDHSYSMMFDVDVKAHYRFGGIFLTTLFSFYQAAEYGSIEKTLRKSKNRKSGESQTEVGPSYRWS